MRKLKLQVQITVDGYVAGPKGELDWMVWDWDDKLKKYVNDLHEPVDTILLGRNMTDGFIGHWTNVATKPEDESYAFAKKMIDTPKVVFSKTLSESKWANTVIAKGDLSEEVNKLKGRQGKDMIVYGGASFDASLIRAGLIEDLHLFVNPIAIGNGLPLFKDVGDRLKLTLAKSTSFDCGVVVQHYQPKKG